MKKFVIISNLLLLSTTVFADVVFKDANNLSDHTVVLRKVGNNAAFLACPLNETISCAPIGNASGYNLYETISIAKKDLFHSRLGTVLMGAIMVIALLLVGGMTLIAAVGVITSLVSGALGTAAISGFVAVLVGSNLFMYSKQIPGDVKETKIVIKDSQALNKGLQSTTSHTITVPELSKFESYLSKVLNK